MIKAVLFDVDGVLIDSFDANHKFVTELLDKFGYSFMEKDAYSNYFNYAMRDIIAHSTNLTDEEEINRIWQAAKDRVVPYPYELIKTPENLEEILKTLKAKYSLGIVTSRSHSGIFSIPHLDALKEYFSLAVGYEDTKEHKPDAAPLLFAAEKLGVKPEECVYIGDMVTDAQAAKAAGMKSITYSKKEQKISDANTSDFFKLPLIIEGLS